MSSANFVDGQPHAVLVPGPLLGHANGMLLLAKALASAGFRVTMACFERAYRAVEGRLKLSDTVSVRLEVVADGLPPEVAALADFCQTTPIMHTNLVQLFQSLSSQQLPATCLISDSLMAWTQCVADEVGIPRVEYWTGSATSYLTILAIPRLITLGYVGSHTGEVPMSWKGKTPILLDCIAGQVDFPLDEVPTDFRYVSLEDPLLQRLKECADLANKAHCFLFHSMYDLESHTFQTLENLVNLIVYPIGPLIMNQSNDSTSASSTLTKWLDTKAQSSVIYVSFGTTVVHMPDEIVELAYGLELSEKPFIWVLRSDSISNKCALTDILPLGFQTRTADRGIIVPWCSQLDVLAHPSVGGFLSHCGWNSTLESLCMGVPLLTCPKRADQPINNRIVVRELGVGIELHISLDKGKPYRHDIEAGIRALLDEASGHLARTRAREFKCMLQKAPCPGGQSHTHLLNFVRKMKDLSLSKSK